MDPRVYHWNVNNHNHNHNHRHNDNITYLGVSLWHVEQGGNVDGCIGLEVQLVLVGIPRVRNEAVELLVLVLRHAGLVLACKEVEGEEK